MRREFAALELGLKEFIEQPDYPTLVLDMDDGDAAFPFGVLQNWDRQWRSHVFLLFPFDCTSVDSYLQQCFDALAMQIDAANETLATDGQPAWPPLPLTCVDPRGHPGARLQAAIMHVRACVQAHANIVWAFVPSSIADVTGYTKLIVRLLALEGVENWMASHRFIVRDNHAKPHLLPKLVQVDSRNTCVLRVDFSVAKAADTLVQNLNNPKMPLSERMDALVQLAAFDLAHGRLEQALEKYDLLHAYHRQQGTISGRALALGGAADVVAAKGDEAQAKRYYQQALALAAPGKDLPVTLNLLMSVGKLCLRLEQYDEAEGYLELADRCAGRLVFLNAKIDAMENLGAAQFGAGKPAEAARTWDAAKNLCREFDCHEPWRSILDRLIALHSGASMHDRAEVYRREKASWVEPPALDNVKPAELASEARVP